MKILHAADFHLDSPFEALKVAEAASRRSEQRHMLRRIAEIANDEEVDAVLFAGDLLDSDSAYLETAEALTRELGLINAPVFIAPGNHDYYSPRSPYARLALPDNVRVFTSGTPECIQLPEAGARIWGAAFTGPSSPAMLADFAPKRSDGETLDIMVIHGEVSARETPYNPITEDEIRRSGMDYIALGHAHYFSGLRRAGGTYYAWPGCPEGRGFDETGEKGVVIALLSPGMCELKFVPLGGRRYEVLSVRAGEDALDSITNALPESTANDIYRITLTGEARDVDIDAIERALRPRFYRLELRDRTTPRRDVWEKSGDEGLRGLFLTKLLAKYNAAATDEERALAADAAKWGLKAFDNADA